MNMGLFNPIRNYCEISSSALESDNPSRRRNPGLMRRYIFAALTHYYRKQRAHSYGMQ